MASFDGGYAHQDWQEVKVRKSSKHHADRPQSAASLHMATTNGGDAAWKIEKKVDDGEGIKSVGREVGNGIARLRAAKKLTQVELAAKVRQQVHVINKIENGSAILDHNTKIILSQIRRILA